MMLEPTQTTMPTLGCMLVTDRLYSLIVFPRSFSSDTAFSYCEPITYSSLCALFSPSPANRIRRDPQQGGSLHGRGPYAQSKLPPDTYVGDFDEVPVGLPAVPCSLQTCCCCANAGKFETINSREERSAGLCLCLGSRTANAGNLVDSEKADSRGPVGLGRRGTRVCITMALVPVLLPFQACRQHRGLTDLYPVESTQNRVRHSVMFSRATV